MSQTTDCRPAPNPAAPNSPGIDARRHRRARANWPVRLIVAGGAIVSCRICDVSEGGFGVFGPANLPSGTLVCAAFAVPQPADPRREMTVQATVRVVFSAFCGTQSRLGVQFLQLPMAARIAIRQYVISHS